MSGQLNSLFYRTISASVLAAVLSLIFGCGEAPSDDPAPQPTSPAGSSSTPHRSAMSLSITSSAFKPDSVIPIKHTGEGEDLSPALRIENLPEGTKSLAIICDDPDAPTAQPWVHWVIYNIPATAATLPEGLPRNEELASLGGARQGINSWDEDNIGYRGPMPPEGHGVHHYHFHLYALSDMLDLPPGASKLDVLKAIEGKTLAQAELIGTYERK